MGRRITTTKAYRLERREKCIEYLREAGTLRGAIKLARTRDHFAANTSAWIGALGHMLNPKGRKL